MNIQDLVDDLYVSKRNDVYLRDAIDVYHLVVSDGNDVILSYSVLAKDKLAAVTTNDCVVCFVQTNGRHITVECTSRVQALYVAMLFGQLLE